MDEISGLALLAFDAVDADNIVKIITREEHYHVYRGTLFGKAGYQQVLEFVPGPSIKGQMDVVLGALADGEPYYVASPELQRAGVYWHEPEASDGLWIELEAQALIGHPVVVEVKRVTADEIEDWLASGRLKRPRPKGAVYPSSPGS